MAVWTQSGGLLSNSLDKHLPALHFQPFMETFWLLWSINWVWVKAPQMIWVPQSVNNEMLVCCMLNSEYIFEVGRQTLTWTVGLWTVHRGEVGDCGCRDGKRWKTLIWGLWGKNKKTSNCCYFNIWDTRNRTAWHIHDINTTSCSRSAANYSPLEWTNQFSTELNVPLKQTTALLVMLLASTNVATKYFHWLSDLGFIIYIYI